MDQGWYVTHDLNQQTVCVCLVCVVVCKDIMYMDVCACLCLSVCL